MRRALVSCLLLVTVHCFAQIDSISQRIFLIGDAGELFGGNNTQPVVDWLQKNVDWNDERNNAIFLGDNIYRRGMSLPGSADQLETEKILRSQYTPLRKAGITVWFVPGNHDWDRMGKLGLAKIKRQWQF